MIYMIMMYVCYLILCIENIIRLKIYFNYFNKIIRSVSLRTLIMNMEICLLNPTSKNIWNKN